MNKLTRVVLFFRQAFFPKELRIPMPGSLDRSYPTQSFFDELAERFSGMQKEIVDVELRMKDIKDSSAKNGSLPKEFSVELANQYYRIKKNLAALEDAGISNKETRMLNRTIESIQRAMVRQEIEIIDYTGKIFIDGQKDFEIAGEPEKQVGLKQKTILFCERPAVILNGQLVQAARGVIAIPEK